MFEFLKSMFGCKPESILESIGETSTTTPTVKQNLIVHPSARSVAADVALDDAKGVYDQFILVGWGKDGLLHHHTGGEMTHEQISFALKAYEIKSIMEFFEEE